MNSGQDLLRAETNSSLSNESDAQRHSQLAVAANEARQAMHLRLEIIKEAQQLARGMQDVNWRELLPPEFFATKPGTQVNVDVSSYADHSNNIDNTNKGGNQELKL